MIYHLNNPLNTIGKSLTSQITFYITPNKSLTEVVI